jgi:hypothetical protein
MRAPAITEWTPKAGVRAEDRSCPSGGRRLAFAVSILPTRKVYLPDVTLAYPKRKTTGRPRRHPVTSAASVSATELIETQPEAFRTILWRTGTKGVFKAGFTALRVCVADGPVAAGGSTFPGKRLGSSASPAPRASASTIRPTIRPTRRLRSWRP